MSTRKATELAWAAGFFDGEGCVCGAGPRSSQIVSPVKKRQAEKWGIEINTEKETSL